MRYLFAIVCVLLGAMSTGCAEKRPEPPAGYVDPGTDPKAMGDSLKPGAPSEAPK